MRKIHRYQNTKANEKYIDSNIVNVLLFIIYE